VALLDGEQVRQAAGRALAHTGSRLGPHRLAAEDRLVQQVTLSAMHKFDLATTKLNL
jgi:hypothetical protein